VDAIADSFAQLFRDAGAEGDGDMARGSASSAMPLDTIRTAVGSQRRLARVLWERLEAKQEAEEYCSRPLTGHRVVLVGAGPCGLRCALELRLLGAEVVVLERRTKFERINRLHLWAWCCEDLKGWGAKVLEPPELSFGSDPDFLHIGISELQMLLLKPCLLLGVQVFFGAEFRGARPMASGSWDVLFGSSNDAAPGPRLPSSGHLSNVSILVGADGPRSTVASSLALPVQETTGLRKEAALGLVANFVNRQSAEEKRRRPFSLARQFYESLFAECEKQTGVALENIVCYIAAHTHYFVMTPTRKSLVNSGVIKAEAVEGETLGSIDQEALARVARDVAAFKWRPEDPVMPEATLDQPAGAPALFDFSRTRRAGTGFQVLEGAAATPGSSAPKLIVGLCGDALIEPFWPEGLGVVRGFFAALDFAASCKIWAQSGDIDAASAQFEAAYRQLKSLAAKTRSAVLRPDDRAFGLHPTTRYRFAAVEGKTRGRANSAPAMPRG